MHQRVRAGRVAYVKPLVYMHSNLCVQPNYAAFVGASNLGMALGPLLSLPLAYVPDWKVGKGGEGGWVQ